MNVLAQWGLTVQALASLVLHVATLPTNPSMKVNSGLLVNDSWSTIWIGFLDLFDPLLFNFSFMNFG